MNEIINLIKIINSGSEIAKAILLWKLKFPLFAISLILNINISTLKGYICFFKRTGKIPEKKKRVRKKKISEEDEMKVLDKERTLGIWPFIKMDFKVFEESPIFRYGLEISVNKENSTEEWNKAFGIKSMDSFS